MSEDALISGREGEASRAERRSDPAVGRSGDGVQEIRNNLTGDEWRSVVGLILDRMGSARLSDPEEHLGYVRKRIRAAVARHVV